MQSNDTRLQQIQSLQFADRAAAETLLLDFIREVFPDLDAVKVELRPLAVSLNSFNGFLTLANGGKLFFKTHVEPGSIIDEYYNSQLLAEAGYPIIGPRYSSTEYGKQFLIYDVIESPSVFDVARAIERGERHDLNALTEAQHQADDDLLQIYLHTLQDQTPEQAGKAAVHQLFYHRLGERYRNFYVGKSFIMPGLTLQWEDLCSRQWVINGLRYEGTLITAIDEARTLIHPFQAGPSIVGHGDAHNGNVFFTADDSSGNDSRGHSLVYFDPAFGGRHHPLLDLTKPIFHNVFATWMYHAPEVAEKLEMTIRDDGDTLYIAHNYEPSMCRRMFFESKIERILKPLINALEARGQLSPQWINMLKSSLMCCPLLTMNLADRNKFPASVGLLGLCYVVEMGLHNTDERTTGESTSSKANTLNSALYGLKN